MASKRVKLKKDSTDIQVINVPSEDQKVTIERIKGLLPKGTSAKVTEEMATQILNLERDTNMPQNLMEESVMSYLYLVSKIPGTGVQGIINAVKFCNLKRNYNNKQAWSIVFPRKFAELSAGNKPIDNFVSAYNTSKLVVEIDKEMLIPVHIQYAGYFHAAVSKQYELMTGNVKMKVEGEMIDVSVAPMVQHLAAKELAVITAQPVETKIDVKVSQSDAMLAAQHEMSNNIGKLVEAQIKGFTEGRDTGEVQRVHVNLIEADIDETGYDAGSKG